MIIPVVKVQINDRTPSANGVKPIVRSVLWGLVQTVVNNDRLRKTSDAFDDSFNIDPDDTRSSQAMRDYEANFLSESEFTLKSLFEKEIQDSYLEGIIGNEPNLDDDMQLPLSFGKRLQTSKNKKNKKKYSPTRYGNDPSFECPAGFGWNFQLPTPPKPYVEDNVYYLCSPGLGASPSTSPSSSAILNGEQSIASNDALRIVRIVGHGPALINNAPNAGSNLVNDEEIETVTVEVVSDCGEVEKRLTADRKHLIKMDEETLLAMSLFIDSVIYNIPEEINTHEGVEEKYWDQRYRLFSLYDRGVQMDSESWFSVTPECISELIADRCLEGAMRSYVRMIEPNLSTKYVGKKRKKKEEKEREYLMKCATHVRVGRMLDLFCGCGGNSIPLARVCDHLVAVDINPAKLVDASANAKIYELETKIEFVCADAYHILGSLATDDTHADTYCNTGVDIVLLAPPWGGPSYCLSKDFDMYTDFPSGNGLELVVEAAKVSKNIVCVFPRNIMMSQVTEMAMAIDSPCRVEQVYLYGKHKLSVLYFGSLFCSV